jgi:ecdysone 20-monooxygenase
VFTFAGLNKLYGDIVLEMSNSIPVISLFNRGDIEKVLQFNSAYPFRPPTEIVSFYRRSRPERYASVGLVNAQGPEWGRLRAKLTPKTLESRRVISTFCTEFSEICDELINVIKERRDEDSVLRNFDELVKTMSLEASCGLILGRKMGYLTDDIDGMDDTTRELQTGMKNIFRIFRDAFYGNGMWKYFPSKLYDDYVATEDKLYDVVMKVIKETLHDSEFMALDRDNMSILAMILKTEGLDMRDKISGVIGMKIAAQLTQLYVIQFYCIHFCRLPPRRSGFIALGKFSHPLSVRKPGSAGENLP